MNSELILLIARNRVYYKLFKHLYESENKKQVSTFE